MQNVALVGDQIPTIDLQDSPTGRRYTLVTAVGQTVEGAPVERFAGVFEVDQRPIAPNEVRVVPAPADHPSPVMGPALSDVVADAVAAGDGAELVRFLLAAERPSSETVTRQVERAIALGQVQSYADRRAVRSALVEQRVLDFAQDMQPIVDAVEAAGATILYRCRIGHCLVLEAPYIDLPTIAALGGVRRLDLPSTPSTDTHETSYDVNLDGNWVRELHQFEQFWDAEHTGLNGSDPRIHAAVYDHEQPLTTHLGFRDWGAPAPPFYWLGPTRVAGQFTCHYDLGENPISGCETFAYQQPVLGMAHGTRVAGNLFGDVMDGQFQSITDPLDRGRRSGYAPEAMAWVYDSAGTSSSEVYATIWDDAAARSPAPAVYVQSLSDGGDDPQCLGEAVRRRRPSSRTSSCTRPACSMSTRRGTPADPASTARSDLRPLRSGRSRLGFTAVRTPSIARIIRIFSVTLAMQ